MRDQIIEIIKQIHNEKTLKGVEPDYALLIEIKKVAAENNIETKKIIPELIKMREEGIIKAGPTINDTYVILNDSI